VRICPPGWRFWLEGRIIRSGPQSHESSFQAFLTRSLDSFHPFLPPFSFMIFFLFKRCWLEARAQGRRAEKASAGKRFSAEFDLLFRNRGWPLQGRRSRGCSKKGRPPNPWKHERLMIFTTTPLGPGRGTLNISHWPSLFGAKGRGARHG
jgi:hypothetical protein